MAKSQNSVKKGSSKKVGRNLRKKAQKNGATSLYVKGKINFETYAKMVGIKSR